MKESLLRMIILGQETYFINVAKLKLISGTTGMKISLNSAF